ncbi:MAG TPA: YfhO family protein, partial [Polyangia bacterium]
LTVLLAPLGLARRRAEVWALGAVAVLGIQLAFGDGTPVHRFFFHYVPLYGALRCPTRALVMDLLALPILAAEGIAWLCDHAGTRRAIGAAVAVAFVVAGIAFAVVLSRDGRLPPGIVASRHAFAHFALVAGAGGALVALLAGGVVPAPVAAAALALVSLVDLVTVGRTLVLPKPADWAAGTERFAAVDWLLAQHPADRFIPDWRGPFRLHNLGMTYGIEGAGGYESFTIWRYSNFLYTLNNGQPYPFAKLKQDLAAGDIKRFDTPLVDLLNVRWYIGTQVPAPGWIERFRPTPGAPPHAVHEPTWDPQLGVWENPHVLPRAFVVHHATVLADDGAQARALVHLDPRADVILDAAPSPAPAGVGFEAARVTALERKRVVVEADLAAAGVLVLSDAWYPGWRVTVDGQAQPLLRADYALRGVALPAGHHVVEFTFRSRPAELGLGLSAVGILLLVALVAIGRKRPTLL